MVISAGGTEGHEPVLNSVGYWQGMPMGVAVAADTEDIANEALKLVEIEWEERPFNLDQEEALKPGAPLTNPESFPNGNFVLPSHALRPRYVYGNPDEGFKEADRIIEWRMRKDKETLGRTGAAQWPVQMERGVPGVVAEAPAAPPLQAPVAEFFKVPVSQVTLHCLYQGGSFGGWSQMALNMQPNIIAGILVEEDREAGQVAVLPGEKISAAPVWIMPDIEVKVGFKKDGTITAVAGNILVRRKKVFRTYRSFCREHQGSSLYSRSRTALS